MQAETLKKKMVNLTIKALVDALVDTLASVEPKSLRYHWPL